MVTPVRGVWFDSRSINKLLYIVTLVVLHKVLLT